ncbi:hypothetical protein NIES4102_10660 [Chondrocystis sp. NIES-4102]|nr:hypothetical protein NIES4102_10660 [Chondrocystis sp. NIES-4102]
MLIHTLELPFQSLKKTIKYTLDTYLEATLAHRVKSSLKWLAPGLFIKRWLLLSANGVFCFALGLISLWQPTDIVNLTFPQYLFKITAIVLGLFLSFWGQIRAFRSIIQVLQPNSEQDLVDLMLAHRRLNKGPKIVALGGGTGLSNLLRGLKHYSGNITAIVTVADDGGSSGRLREELGVLPPGDIRNCITALAKEEGLLTELFQYRFRAGDGLKGHSFGNLFLTAMSEITGNLEKAIAASSKVLAVQGQVLPATLNDVHLWAELEQGQRIVGESNIAQAQGKIQNIGCIPANPEALPATIEAIKSADYIILGPGSLYTSIIPNLLVPEIREAIANAKVPRVYVCNIMTQPGETDDYTVADHIKAIDQVCGQKLFDAVIVNQTNPSRESLNKYSQEGSSPVILDRDQIALTERQLILAPFLDEDPQTHTIRHHSQRLAAQLFYNLPLIR